MSRLVAICAPAGYGKTTYLLKQGGRYLALLPGEGSPEDLVRILWWTLRREKPGGPPHRAFRELLTLLGDEEVHLAVDDVHHLTPEAGDYLLSLLHAPGVRLTVAGRELISLRSLPRLVADGIAQVIEVEDLVRLTGWYPQPLEKEVEARLEAMPPKEHQALLRLAGLPLWREEDLQGVGLTYHTLVVVHGLPVQRANGVYWPHEVLQSALVARAPTEVLVTNARRLAEKHPPLAARLYLQAGVAEAALPLLLRQAEEWVSEGLWSEAVSWIEALPSLEGLEPLQGVFALALLETGQVERALRLAGIQDDPFSLATRGIAAFRRGNFKEALALAKKASQSPFWTPVGAILAERVALATRLALGEPRDALFQEARELLAKAEIYPGQALMVRSFILHLLPGEGKYGEALVGFQKALESRSPVRAASFLSVMVESSFLEANKGNPSLLHQTLGHAVRYREVATIARPALPYAYKLEASLRAYLGDLDEAASLLEKARGESLALGATSVWAFATELLLEVYLAQDKLQEAARALSELEQVHLTHNLPAPYLHRALLQLRMGQDLERIREDLAQAVELGGENAIVARTLMGLPADPTGKPFALLSLRLLGLEAWPKRVLSLRDRKLYTPDGTYSLSEVELRILLALLLSPATADELAERVYGDPAKAGAVHTAVHRLRQRVSILRYGTRYALEDCRLDLALNIEAARQVPTLLPLELRAYFPGDCPVCLEWYENLLLEAKNVVREWLAKGVRISRAELLDPEDPEYLGALGNTPAVETLREGHVWR